jgi:hypothetical protein
MSKSNLGPGQIQQFVYDEESEALKVIPVAGSIVTEAYDYVAVTYPLATQEVYTFKSGGVGGTTVATVTINYTDATKANLLNASKV